MGFGESITTCFRKTFTYSGRASRSEFWWFYLFTSVIGKLSTGILELFYGADFDALVPNLIDFGIALVLVFPQISVCCRRFHDIGRSGWYQLVLFLALVLVGVAALIFETFDRGPFFAYATITPIIVILATFLVFMIKRSQPGTNKYGPNPLEVST
jgi:uncharacterized membrane protein YhaH (DUF805 family)